MSMIKDDVLWESESVKIDDKIIFSDDFSSGNLSKWANVVEPAQVIDFDGEKSLCLFDKGQVHQVFVGEPDDYCMIKITAKVYFTDIRSILAIPVRSPTLPYIFPNIFSASDLGVNKWVDITLITPCYNLSEDNRGRLIVEMEAYLHTAPKIYVRDVEISQSPVNLSIDFFSDSWKKYISINDDSTYSQDAGVLTINASEVPASTQEFPKEMLSILIEQPGNTTAGAFIVMSAEGDESAEKTVMVYRHIDGTGLDYLYSDINDFSNEFYTGTLENSTSKTQDFTCNMGIKLKGESAGGATIKIKKVLFVLTKNDG